MFKFLFSILIFIVLISKNLYSNECTISNKLKIGIIKNGYINYEDYIQYELSKFSSNNSIDYSLAPVENNIDEFDIIFGEYYDLKKLSVFEIEYPQSIRDFYSLNGINNKNNILPLDLDVNILLTKNKIKDRVNLEDLTKINDPKYYTIGLSYKNKYRFINLLSDLSMSSKIDTTNIFFETNLHNLFKVYKNLNKSLINSNFLEVYDSYNISENLFSLFTDGILLNNEIEYRSFLLFPKSKYKWDDQNGIFKINLNNDFISTYGFSAYINNTNQFGFLCHLLKENVRINTFTKFNIQIGPFSEKEIYMIKDTIPKDYFELLTLKNDRIFEIKYQDGISNYDLILDIVLNKKKINVLNGDRDYLN